MLAIAAVGAVSSYFVDYWLNRAGERIVHALRVATYAQLQRLSLAFHARRHKGDLVTRVTGDVNAVGTLFADTLGAWRPPSSRWSACSWSAWCSTRS